MNPSSAKPSERQPALNDAQRAILDQVLDQIVPPTPDGRLPGASQVGVLNYLQSLESTVLATVARELDTLEQAARTGRDCAFTDLTPTDQHALVETLRSADPQFFARLALEAVTCYYQDDRVLTALDIETRPPFPEGFQVIAGDLELLAPVRRRGQVYRNA